MSGLSPAKLSHLSKPHAFNQSRVKQFLRCQRAYYYRYDYPILVMGTEPNTELVHRYPGLPLRRGTWMHALLEAHYKGMVGDSVVYEVKKGKKTIPIECRGWEELNEVMGQQYNKLFDEERELYGDLPGDAARLFKGYLKRWDQEDKRRYRIATLPDGKPAVEFVISYPLNKWGIDAPFKGRVDILVEDLEMGGLWIRDAKWVKAIPGPDERMMSPQNIVYVYVMRKLGFDVRGFIYDYGRTKVPTEPRILKRSSQYGPAGSVSLAKCDTTVAVYKAAVKAAHGASAKTMVKTYYRDKLEELKRAEVTWYHRERIPVEGPRLQRGFKEFLLACHQIQNRTTRWADYASGGPPRNYIYNCKWNCSYHEPCVAEFQGGDIERLLKTQYVLEAESYKPEEID